MPPLNPNLTASLSEKEKVKVEEESKSICKKVKSDLKRGHEGEKSGYTEEINANHVPFPSEESFHLPEPLTKSDESTVLVSSSSGTKGGQIFEYIPNGSFDIVWPNVTVFALGHILHVYCLYILFTDPDVRTRWTWIWSYWVGVVGGLGITAGAHRLWSHKSYKAKLPLRIFLMVGQCIAGQNCLYIWCRDHRVHHKYSETDADPHNTNRGFFFAHVGWLLRKKHPTLLAKCKKIDFSDLLADPVVRFQKKYYPWLYLTFAVFGPSFIPMIFWQESLFRSLLIVYISRYITSLHSTWFVNSTAHMFGDRPYNKNIQPRENIFVSYGAFGEGYHNYHHTFPFDYATSELGCKINATKKFIDFMAFIGQVYDRKQMSSHLVDNRKREHSTFNMKMS